MRLVNEDHDAIEIVSKHGNAVLVSAEDYSALREGAYLLRSPHQRRHGRIYRANEAVFNGILWLYEKTTVFPIGLVVAAAFFGFPS